jgi:hypothetical protein
LEKLINRFSLKPAKNKPKYSRKSSKVGIGERYPFGTQKRKERQGESRQQTEQESIKTTGNNSSSETTAGIAEYRGCTTSEEAGHDPWHNDRQSDKREKKDAGNACEEADQEAYQRGIG